MNISRARQDIKKLKASLNSFFVQRKSLTDEIGFCLDRLDKTSLKVSERSNLRLYGATSNLSCFACYSACVKSMHLMLQRITS